MTVLLFTGLAFLALGLAYHAGRQLLTEFEQAFDLSPEPLDPHADPDTLGATDPAPGAPHD